MAEISKVEVEPGSTQESALPGADDPKFAGIRTKFTGPDAATRLMESYLEMEQRLHTDAPQQPLDVPQQQPQQQPQPEAAPETPAPEAKALLTAEEMSQYAEEFQNSGGLSDKSYADLAKRGASREMVDNYIAGQQSRANELAQSCYEVVGGEQNYASLQEWIGSNATDAEVNAFNAAINSGDPATARMAVQAMAYAYQAASGGAAPAAGPQTPMAEPQRLEGNSGPSLTGNGFQSAHEMRQAFKDPRYTAGDPAYHQWVQEQIAKSPEEIWKAMG